MMYHRLEADRVGRGQSIVLAILFANVFVQSNEVVYHFTFPVYLNYFKAPFFNGDDARYLAMEVPMLVPVVLVWRHLRFGYLSAVLLLSFVMTWGGWVLFGFPQYFVGSMYYPQVLTTTDSYHLSLALNFLSKTLLVLLFASVAQRRIGQRYVRQQDPS